MTVTVEPARTAAAGPHFADQRPRAAAAGRNLDDEEDLVIPLLLERGEGALAGVEADHLP